MKLIQRQSKKMTNLITDMLAFARLEFQIDSFEMHKVNFTKLVSAVCEDMAQIQDKNITLTGQTYHTDICPHYVTLPALKSIFVLLY